PGLFQDIDETLDHVAFLILLAIVVARLVAILARRNHGHGSVGLDLGDQRVTVVGLVADHFFGLAIPNQIGRFGDIMILSWTQKDLRRLAQAIDGHMNLRADAAARTSELLLLRRRVLLPGRMLMG